jgi:hypothetical protein
MRARARRDGLVWNDGADGMPVGVPPGEPVTKPGFRTADPRLGYAQFGGEIRKGRDSQFYTRISPEDATLPDRKERVDGVDTEVHRTGRELSEDTFEERSLTTRTRETVER